MKSQAKRKRELAKLDKRQAKDQKRALRKAERAGLPTAAAPQLQARPATVIDSPAVTTPPLTLAEAARRWKEYRAPKPTKFGR